LNDSAVPSPPVTFIFRKRIPTFFSIEKLFECLYADFQRSGMPLTRLELPHVSAGLLSVLRNMWFAARQRKARIVHITGDVHYAALLCLQSRALITVHDCVVLQRGVGFKRFVMRLLWFGLPLRLAAAVVVISERTKQELLATVAIPPHKVIVIPNFIDPSFTPAARPFAADLPRILHVGTTPNKNLPRVIEALRDAPCVLTIVGDLTEDTIQQLRVSGIRHEHYFSVDHATMLELYRGADIVSFPSTYEGFGMPILEGQAVGRCVLTSDIEPLRSVAGPDGALLVDPYSVDSIREGFRCLLSDADVRARLVAAGARNCSRFTLDAVAAQYAAVYRRLDELKR